MIFARTTSAADTQALAAALAELARPGDLFLLAGDLGAGKTAFTQGFGAALGVEERITSPTFTLANTYVGRLELNHLDVYRLEALAEVLDLGVPEMLDDGGVAVIEWGDTVAPALPADYLEVRFSFTEGGDEERILDLVPVGGRWQARTRALAAALAPWIHEADVPPSPAAWLEADGPRGPGGGAAPREPDDEPSGAPEPEEPEQ